MLRSTAKLLSRFCAPALTLKLSLSKKAELIQWAAERMIPGPRMLPVQKCSNSFPRNVPIETAKGAFPPVLVLANCRVFGGFCPHVFSTDFNTMDTLDGFVLAFIVGCRMPGNEANAVNLERVLVSPSTVIFNSFYQLCNYFPPFFLNLEN